MPEIPSGLGSGILYIPNLNPSESMKKLYEQPHEVLFVDMETYIKEKYNIWLRIDVNKYFKKYQIKIPTEVRKLSKNLIKAQNDLYLRAAEEILEMCNESMLESNFFLHCIVSQLNRENYKSNKEPKSTLFS